QYGAKVDRLPTVGFGTTGSWGRPARTGRSEAANLATLRAVRGASGGGARHDYYGQRWLVCECSPPVLFTENGTNFKRLFGIANRTPYVKDSVHDYVIRGWRDAVNPSQQGTKASAHYPFEVPSGGS